MYMYIYIKIYICIYIYICVFICMSSRTWRRSLPGRFAGRLTDGACLSLLLYYSRSLELSDTKFYEPELRAHLYMAHPTPPKIRHPPTRVSVRGRI